MKIDGKNTIKGNVLDLLLFPEITGVLLINQLNPKRNGIYTVETGVLINGKSYSHANIKFNFPNPPTYVKPSEFYKLLKKEARIK